MRSILFLVVTLAVLTGISYLGLKAWQIYANPGKVVTSVVKDQVKDMFKGKKEHGQR